MTHSMFVTVAVAVGVCAGVMTAGVAAASGNDTIVIVLAGGVVGVVSGLASYAKDLIDHG